MIWGWTWMRKAKLTEAVTAHKTETKEALQLLFDNINKGQQKQIVKREEIKKLFDRYGVEY